MKRTKESEMLRQVRIAVCGELPSVCEYLTKQGIIHIDKYGAATDMGRESDYHLILVHAPSAEGLLNACVWMSENERSVPIRHLGEPACRSALLDVKMTIHGIAKALSRANAEVASNG